MANKDQLIGGIIFIVCVVVGILYTIGLFFWPSYNYFKSSVPLWLLVIPVFLAFIAIMAIGAWIGWTMATTPPPKPIEEITAKPEEKEEEKPAEEPATATETEETEEEKKPERKKKS
jgi:flagellar basal body-associated protein FliL